MPASPISNSQKTIQSLAADRAKHLGIKENAIAVVKDCDRQLVEITTPADKLKEKGKDYGDVSYEEAGLKFTSGSDKKVKWDSAQLQNIAAELPWNLATSMFKITFEMSETAYKSLVTNVQNGLQSKELLERVNAARTVEIGEMKIKKIETI